MSSKIELTKTLINALLNENRKSTVTPSQLATLYQHLLSIIEEDNSYTKEETDELIKTAKSAVLKTLRLQWFNTGNSIGLFTATNEELTRVSDVARQTALDTLRAVLSQPREFFINDTADKFDGTADSYFTEDIDGETIQFIDEEFTAVGADALTLPVSICQGGETIATFPAAFTRRLFDDSNPDSWNIYEGHAIFESAGSVWKFIYNSVPANNEQSLELAKISAKDDSTEVLEIFLNPQSGFEKPYRFWKGKRDRKYIKDNQSILNVNKLFSYDKPKEKSVILDLKCIDSSGNKISVFKGTVSFSLSDRTLLSEGFCFIRDGITYRVSFIFGGEEIEHKYSHIYFKSSVIRQHDKTAPIHIKWGICPAHPHEGCFYRNTGEIRLGLSKQNLISYKEKGNLSKVWDLSHFGNIPGVFDACSKGLISDGLVQGTERTGIKVRIANDTQSYWASSDDVEFKWDSITKRLAMDLHTPDLTFISIRIQYTKDKDAPYIGRPYGYESVYTAQNQFNIEIIEKSLPDFQSKNLRLCSGKDISGIQDLLHYLSGFHDNFQIQRMTVSSQKTYRSNFNSKYKTKKWTGIRESNTSKCVLRIRNRCKRGKTYGPWLYFRFNSNTLRPVRLL
jgi:hypothetical protein